MKESIFFCIVGLPIFGKEGSGTPVFKILMRALYTYYVAFYESVTSFSDMEKMDSIAEHFGIKRYRSVAAVCAIYPDAQTAETHLYLKLTSFCVNILIVLFRILKSQ